MADSANVRVGYAGKAWFADLGATFPTDVDSAWNGTIWTDGGLVNEDGLSESISQDSTDISAWGYDGPARTIMSNKVTMFSLTFIETNRRILSLFYDVPEDDMVHTAATGAHPEFIAFHEGQPTGITEFALGLDVVDLGVGKRSRFEVARAQVVNRGDVSYNKQGAVSFQLGMKALLDEDGYSVYRMYGGLDLA